MGILDKFKRTNEQPPSFAERMDELDALLEKHNKEFALSGLERNFTVQHPNPNPPNKNASSCFTHGYTIDMGNKSLTLYATNYKDGKFKAEESIYKKMPAGNRHIESNNTYKDISFEGLKNIINTTIEEGVSPEEEVTIQSNQYNFEKDTKEFNAGES